MAITGNNPLLAGRGVTDVAVQVYGSEFLKRGGPIGRAMSEMSRGRTIAEAATIAARQGKGHIGELRVAAEQSMSAGVLGVSGIARPNPVANDPVFDVEILSGEKRIGGAQVGVGSPAYTRRKALRSPAPQVVINQESRDVLRLAHPAAFERSDDTLRHGATLSRPLMQGEVETEARQILERSLLNVPLDAAGFSLRVAGSAGLTSAAHVLARTLLFDVAHRLHAGIELDRAMATTALENAVETGVRTGLQTYVMVNRFLERAGEAFQSKLLQAAGKSATIAGAIADVVVSTAGEVWRCLRGEISFEELLRRFGAHVVTAAGAAAGVASAMYLTRGCPWWVQVVAALLAGTAGAEIGRRGGDLLFAPTWPVPAR